MKAILMSVKPENLVKILKGEEDKEFMKSIPNTFKGGIYLYCNKGNYYLYNKKLEVLNGKVVSRFWFDKYQKQLEVFDKPKELGEFYTIKRIPSSKNATMVERLKNANRLEVRTLTKAPTRWMYVEVVE